MVSAMSEFGKRIGVPGFYVSFVLAPLASNASELIASYNYAMKKTSKSITISLTALCGAGSMNNTFTLGVFMMLIYAKGLAWQFTAETMAILIAELLVGCMALYKVKGEGASSHSFLTDPVTGDNFPQASPLLFAASFAKLASSSKEAKRSRLKSNPEATLQHHHLQILQHLKNYTNPAIQRLVIRVVFLVPAYAVTCYLSFLYRDSAVYWQIPKDCYEAWAIYSFLSLVLSYLGGPDGIVQKSGGKALATPSLLCTCFLVPVPVNSVFMARCIQCCMQLALMKAICSLIILILALTGHYGYGDWSTSVGYPYLTVSYVVSCMIAYHWFLLLQSGIKELAQPVSLQLKFAYFNFVIFFTFWQSVIISLIVAAGNANPMHAITLSNFTIVMEMIVVALLNFIAFPASGSHTVDNLTVQDSKLGLFRAFLHALSIGDVLSEIKAQFSRKDQPYALSLGYSNEGEDDSQGLLPKGHSHSHRAGGQGLNSSSIQGDPDGVGANFHYGQSDEENVRLLDAPGLVPFRSEGMARGPSPTVYLGGPAGKANSNQANFASSQGGGQQPGNPGYAYLTIVPLDQMGSQGPASQVQSVLAGIKDSLVAAASGNSLARLFPVAPNAQGAKTGSEPNSHSATDVASGSATTSSTTSAVTNGPGRPQSSPAVSKPASPPGAQANSASAGPSSVSHIKTLQERIGVGGMPTYNQVAQRFPSSISPAALKSPEARKVRTIQTPLAGASVASLSTLQTGSSGSDIYADASFFSPASSFRRGASSAGSFSAASMIDLDDGAHIEGERMHSLEQRMYSCSTEEILIQSQEESGVGAVVSVGVASISGTTEEAVRAAATIALRAAQAKMPARRVSSDEEGSSGGGLARPAAEEGEEEQAASSSSDGTAASTRVGLDIDRIRAMSTLDHTTWDQLHVPGKAAPFVVRGAKYLTDRKKIPAAAPFVVRGAKYLTDRKKILAGRCAFTLAFIDIAALFVVRSAKYLTDRKKIPAGRCAFTLASIDIAAPLVVRGAKFLTDRKKIPAGRCAFTLASIDIAAPFVVRGAKYLTDRKKIPAGRCAFTLASIDIVPVPHPMDHIARFLPAIRRSGMPFGIIIHITMPGTPLLGFVASFVSESHPRMFVHGDCATRNTMLKLIPHIEVGPWMIKQAVGVKPVIIGKALKTTYHETAQYIEIDIDISANAVANYATALVRGATKKLVVDMGFVLEGIHPWELPEAPLGTMRLNHLDLTINAGKPIDLETEIPMEPPVQVADPGAFAWRH
eukprot:gene7195-304_t